MAHLHLSTLTRTAQCLPRVAVGLVAFALVGGCQTTPVRDVPTTEEAPPPRQVSDADVLRERVTRLERRLADVDAKLALMLAQRDGGGRSVARYQPRVEPEREPGSLLPLESSSGARAIDLDREAPVFDDEPALDSAVEPPASAEVAPEDDDTGTVVITLDERGRVRSNRGGVSRSSPVKTSPRRELTSVQADYNAAHAHLKAGRVSEARAVFATLAAPGANHRFVDNAMYWGGYCEAQLGQHRKALEVWQALIARDPKSPKVPDALFGLAQSHEALSEPALAETYYVEIVTQFPQAERQVDAQAALARLRR